MYMKKKTNLMKYYLHKINNSKLLAGVVMLLLNVGSKYIELGLSKTQEEALRNALGRELLIFAVVFMGTHDIILSIIMTASFLILSNHLFNEKSKYCLIPQHFSKMNKIIDTNNDNYVSEEEEKKALDILEKAKSQKKKYNQKQFLSYMENNKYTGTNLY
jgi:hypothetical protein